MRNRFQWEKALNLTGRISEDRVSWQRVALLYQTGKLEEYRMARTQLLANLPDNLSPHLVHMFSLVSLLEPLDDDLRQPLLNWLSAAPSRNNDGNAKWSV